MVYSPYIDLLLLVVLLLLLSLLLLLCHSFRIGVGEKGYVTFRIAIKTEAGHSSMPPPETSIVTLGKALTR